MTYLLPIAYGFNSQYHPFAFPSALILRVANTGTLHLFNYFTCLCMILFDSHTHTHRYITIFLPSAPTPSPWSHASLFVNVLCHWADGCIPMSVNCCRATLYSVRVALTDVYVADAIVHSQQYCFATRKSVSDLLLFQYCAATQTVLFALSPSPPFSSLVIGTRTHFLYT